VQATVLARLDALDPAARRLIQIGSVFGRSFSAAGVTAVDGDLAADALAAVERLIDRELLRPAGRGDLVFRHILIRDVAYGTLPRSERARHHAAAARWLEAAAAGRGDELAELIALHFREAAVLGEASGLSDPDLRSRAVAWLRRAAEVTSGARGIAEAAAHLRAAIDLAPANEQPQIYLRLGQIYYSGDPSTQAFANAWRLGQAQGMDADFLLDSLAHQLMVVCRWFGSVARQLSLDELTAVIEQGRAWLPDAGPRAKARFLIALGFVPFWLRNAGIRLPSASDIDEARRNASEGLAIAEQLDDAALISAALDATGAHSQVSTPASARELARRREAMGARLPADERLDALNMIAWTSAMLGDLPQLVESATAALALVEPGQNAGFSLGSASWIAYAQAMFGDWGVLVPTIEDLRNRWIDEERPAASFALQGFLSGIDWARNRGDGDLLDRWLAPATDIIMRFDAAHPVAALQSLIDLDLDGMAGVIANHMRYPDRGHYVEHSLALCADRMAQVPISALDEIVTKSEASQMRILEAQARRLRGLLQADDSDLAASLQAFEAMGARRYACRVRMELGRANGDEALVAAGRREIDDMGELDYLNRSRGTV
jgi:hypothetical protein